MRTRNRIRTDRSTDRPLGGRTTKPRVNGIPAVVDHSRNFEQKREKIARIRGRVGYETTINVFECGRGFSSSSDRQRMCAIKSRNVHFKQRTPPAARPTHTHFRRRLASVDRVTVVWSDLRVL